MQDLHGTDPGQDTRARLGRISGYRARQHELDNTGSGIDDISALKDLNREAEISYLSQAKSRSTTIANVTTQEGSTRSALRSTKNKTTSEHGRAKNSLKHTQRQKQIKKQHTIAKKSDYIIARCDKQKNERQRANNSEGAGANTPAVRSKHASTSDKKKTSTASQQQKTQVQKNLVRNLDPFSTAILTQY